MPAGNGPAPGPRRLRLPVPVTIVTGALAAGKTTAIAALLQHKPPGEEWAVLVNEFGAAGLDRALLEGSLAGSSGLDGSGGLPGAESVTSSSTAGGGTAAAAPALANDFAGVHIRQLAGGCLCCVQSGATPLVVAQLVRAVKPDRLVIEPSGLGHPAALLDLLQGGHLGGSLTVGPVVCLVDATQFAGGASAPPACQASPLLVDQVSISDVLVGSKADLCDAATLAAFERWAGGLFPPKQLVTTAAGGKLDAEARALVLHRPAERAAGSASGGGTEGGLGGRQQQQQALPMQRVRRVPAGSPWLSSSGDGMPGAAPAADSPQAGSSQPWRKAVQDGSGACAACGWVFDRECLFDQQRLQALLHLLQRSPRVLRLKGVFRVGPGRWAAISAAPSYAPPGSRAEAEAEEEEEGKGAQLQEVAYRRDSRVELIIDTSAASTQAETAAAGAGNKQPAASGSGGSEGLEGQVAALALQDPADSGAGNSCSPPEKPVAAALASAAGGSWDALQELLLSTLDKDAS